MEREHVHAPMRPVEADVDASADDDPILLAARWQTADEAGEDEGED